MNAVRGAKPTPTLYHPPAFNNRGAHVKQQEAKVWRPRRLQVRLGGNPSRAAGRVPDAGRYVQPHRGGMEPGDAATPMETGASQENPPFLLPRRGKVTGYITRATAAPRPNLPIAEPVLWAVTGPCVRGSRRAPDGCVMEKGLDRDGRWGRGVDGRDQNGVGGARTARRKRTGMPRSRRNRNGGEGREAEHEWGRGGYAEGPRT